MKISVPWTQLALILGVLIISTLVIAFNGWDMQLANLFYVPGEGFPIGKLQPWRALYLYGEWPAFILGGSATLVYIFSFFRQNLQRFRPAAAFVALLLIIGPGLLANVVFKDHWGRPRPRQVIQFAGTMEFHQTWQPGPAPRNASFPAGHPTVAFYMSAPYFVLRRVRPWQAKFWLLGGFIFGFVMGAARITQGGHFLSDVVWSAGFVYITMLILAALLKPEGIAMGEVEKESQI